MRPTKLRQQQNPSMPSIKSHVAWKILHICVVGVLILFAFSFAIGVLPRINAVVFPQLYWFVLPLIVFCWKFFEWSKPSEHLPASIRLAGEQAMVISVVVGLALGLFALALSGSELSISGLHGHLLEGAPDGLRMTWSFFDLISAAFVEEAAVRGWFQLRLQTLVRTIFAESIADVFFVLLHVLRFASPGGVSHALREFALVSALSIVNGRITSKSQSIVWPILVHAICNGTIFVAAVVISRP